jgi:hypothetical protein
MPAGRSASRATVWEVRLEVRFEAPFRALAVDLPRVDFCVNGFMAMNDPPSETRLANANRRGGLAIIAAGFVTAYTHSIWPDLVVGLAIAAINGDAARRAQAMSSRLTNLGHRNALPLRASPIAIPVFGHNAGLPFGAAAKYKGST